MDDKPRILIDLNILMDILQARKPFFEQSLNLLTVVENGQVDAFIAAHNITTLFYLIKKDRSASEARAVITKIFQMIKILTLDQEILEKALQLDYRDFEDAVQMVSAAHNNIDCLITRNIKDFQPALIPVMQPVEFLSALP